MIEMASPACFEPAPRLLQGAPSQARARARPPATRESTPQASLRGALPANGGRACRAGWPEVHRHAARLLAASRPAAVLGRAPGTFPCARKRRRGPWAGRGLTRDQAAVHTAPAEGRSWSQWRERLPMRPMRLHSPARSALHHSAPEMGRFTITLIQLRRRYVCIVAPQISMPLSTMAILRHT